MRNSRYQSHQHTPYSNRTPRTYHVFHLVKGHNEWRIIDADKNQLIGQFQHEIKARQAVLELAKKSRPSRVVIYNLSGKICGSSTYP